MRRMLNQSRWLSLLVVLPLVAAGGCRSHGQSHAAHHPVMEGPVMEGPVVEGPAVEGPMLAAPYGAPVTGHHSPPSLSGPLIGPQYQGNRYPLPNRYVEERRQLDERFDPYPATDVGPEIVGGRPRDYQKPRAETTRGRWWQPAKWKFW